MLDHAAVAQPSGISVQSLRRLTSADPMLIPRDGLVAGVEFELAGSSIYLGVTRLAGEDKWTADSCFRGLMPLWANGIGARYLATQTVRDPAIVAALDAAAAAAGLAPAPA